MKTQDIEHLASEYSQQDWNRLEYAKIYREGFIAGANEVNAEVEQLQQRNAELAAQVGQLQRLLHVLITDIEWHHTKTAFIPIALAVKVASFKDAVKATPIQFLVEHDREVAARAVDKFGEHLIWDRLFSKSEVRNAAAAFKAEIKSGEVEI